MKWLMNKKMRFSKNQKGLTLVELLAVIVILGVIAAIAVPAIGGIISSSKVKADAQTQLLVANAAERWAMDTDFAGGTVTLASLSPGYLKTTPVSQVNPAGSITISVGKANGAYTATVVMPVAAP